LSFKKLYLTESEQPLQFSLSKKLKVEKFEFRKDGTNFIIKTLTLPEINVKLGDGVRAMLEIYSYCDKKGYDVVLDCNYQQFVDSVGLDYYVEGVRVQVALVL